MVSLFFSRALRLHGLLFETLALSAFSFGALLRVLLKELSESESLSCTEVDSDRGVSRAWGARRALSRVFRLRLRLRFFGVVFDALLRTYARLARLHLYALCFLALFLFCNHPLAIRL